MTEDGRRDGRPAEERFPDTPGKREDGREDVATRWLGVRCGIALCLLQLASWMTNSELFPSFDGIFPVAREISTFSGVLFFLLLAYLTTRHPAFLRGRLLTLGAGGALALSVVLGTVGVPARSLAAITAGALLGSAASAWFTTIVFVALMQMEMRRCAPMVVIAYTASYLLQFLLSGHALPWFPVRYLLCFAGVWLCVRPCLDGPLGAIRRAALQRELAITSPLSFLPLSHPLFVTILLFSFACGYALTFRSLASMPVQTGLIFVPLLVIAIVVAARHGKLDVDLLFSASVLMVLAGFLLVPLEAGTTQGRLYWANLLIGSGSACFTLMFTFLVALIASRNRLAVVSVAAIAEGASWCGIGLGAILGNGCNALAASPGGVDLVYWMNAAVMLAFVAYSFVYLKGFSFQKMVDQVEPVPTPQPMEERPGFSMRCAEVARRYGLTGRETEVLELLARGRTSGVIQEKLVISLNTVRTHVKSIYVKMGIHSQQELIDIVEDGL